jgi:hypothetical protein
VLHAVLLSANRCAVRHPRASGDPGFFAPGARSVRALRAVWIPAFAGMTAFAPGRRHIRAIDGTTPSDGMRPVTA